MNKSAVINHDTRACNRKRRTHTNNKYDCECNPHCQNYLSMCKATVFSNFVGNPEHFEDCPPGKAGVVVPVARRQYQTTPAGATLMVEMRDGTYAKCHHIGKGLLMLEEHYEAVLEAFTATWPWEYGSRDVNSKDIRSLRHREAYDKLISYLWPAGTDERFLGLKGFPHRAPFHRDRLHICLSMCNFIYLFVFRQIY
jgi:hypothetical protein